MLLRKSGAHLHADERAIAEIQARRRPGIWALAGVGAKSLKERAELDSGDMADNDKVESGESGWEGTRLTLAGSAPT